LRTKDTRISPTRPRAAREISYLIEIADPYYFARIVKGYSSPVVVKRARRYTIKTKKEKKKKKKKRKKKERKGKRKGEKKQRNQS